MERNEQMNSADRILEWVGDRLVPWVMVILGVFFLLLVVGFVIAAVVNGMSGGVERACIIGQDGLEYCR